MGYKFNPFLGNFDIDSKGSGSGSGDVTGPASSTDNDIAVFDGTTGKLIKDGGKTIAQVLDRSNHTGTQPASTISDFDTEVSNNTDVSANTAHRNTTSGNPHNVTKSDVGLGNVDNTSDLDKPISTATQTALDAKEDVANKVSAFQATPDDTHYPTEKLVKDNLDTIQSDLDSHKSDTSNPHSVTASQVGAYTTTETDNLLGDKEDKSNKVSSWQATPDDTHYPSEKLTKDSIDTVQSNLDTHTSDNSNPHNVTASQVGINSTDDISEGTTNLYYTEDRVSDNSDVSANTTHRGRTDNPHGVTASQVGAVSKSGDTMTGFLTLNDDPTNNLHAATKQYVDNIRDIDGGSFFDTFNDTNDIDGGTF